VKAEAMPSPFESVAAFVQFLLHHRLVEQTASEELLPQGPLHFPDAEA
jgi:hypothetical protein